MTAYVYILQSEKNGQYYIGSTQDVEKRVKEHKTGRVFSTQSLRPIKIVFKQEFEDIVVAEKIERKLKRFKSRKILEKIISESKILMKV